MSIRHQFNDEDNRASFVKPGVYPATIVRAEETISKASGNEMIKLAWKLDTPADWVWDYLTFSSKTTWRVNTFLKACGIAPEKGNDIELVADELVGLHALLELEIEEDRNGQTRNRVARYVAEESEVPDKEKKEKKDNLPF
ncbi:MAG: DUF669 domain-containing protein [Clostridia bacterium]|jgi:hypothetical protein